MNRAGAFLQQAARLGRRIDEAPVGPAPIVPVDSLPANARDDTIAVLLEQVRNLVGYEEQRANQLASRGTGLVGFASVATAVLAVAAANTKRPVIVDSFIGLAALSLTLCVAMVVFGIFATRPVSNHGLRQIRLYAKPAYWMLSPGRVQVQMLDSLVRRLDTLRRANRARATWLNRAAMALMVAVSCAALAAGSSLSGQAVQTTPIPKEDHP